MRSNNGLMRLLRLALCLCLMLGMIAAIAPVDAEATEANTVTINMFDSYGDGWGNNAINILEDGVVIATATIDTGKEASWSFTMDPEKAYSFAWVKGSWSSECYFNIIINGETVYSATTSDCNLLPDGKVFYPECKHLDCKEVVTAPTCKKDGYTTFTCNTCGESYVGNETPATGHSFGDDDFCDACGFDINSIPVVISMSDSFGDGWNGNAILVYEDGELIDTVVLEPGNRNGTWTYDLDRNKSYDFFWKLGNFPGECSFTIAYDDVIVYTANQNTCSKFKNNQMIYPPCPHTDCDEVVTPATCTKYGFTTYTCKKCGDSYIGDIVYAMGHEYGNDSICDVCGFDKDGIMINMTDSYGDGWNGNAIEIYEDGVLIGTATLTSGKEGTYVVSVDKSKEYTFCWVKGNSGYECSFEIVYEGETKYSATGTNCNNFISGQQVYPFVEYSGWTVLAGKVYYFDPVTHNPLTYAQRLPYPTEPLNGVTYAPNTDDIAEAERKGQTFIDKDQAWFVFDGFTGALLQDVTAIRSVGVMGTYDYRYVVQGMIPWHVGLVEENGYYWYFDGDYEHGGNMVTHGDVTVFRNNTDFDMMAGGVYTFDWSGHMCMYDGITEVDGVLRYYENSRLMLGNGITKVGEDYIYVRTNGELAIGKYYITNVENDDSGLFVSGQKILFGEDGIAQLPKTGIQEVDGELYYLVNNHIQYNAGLIEVNGGWIYVRSNGKLATGKYWITNTNGAMEAGYYEFDENGFMIITDTPDGIVADGESLYYYKNGMKQFGLGLVQLEDGSYIYVRCSGELAVGPYWVTNHNDLLNEGMYEFSADGILTVN